MLAAFSLGWFTDARVAELVDALVLGTSIYDVGVRVPPLVP